MSGNCNCVFWSAYFNLRHPSIWLIKLSKQSLDLWCYLKTSKLRNPFIPQQKTSIFMRPNQESPQIKHNFHFKSRVWKRSYPSKNTQQQCKFLPFSSQWRIHFEKYSNWTLWKCDTDNQQCRYLEMFKWHNYFESKFTQCQPKDLALRNQVSNRSFLPNLLQT